VLGISAANTVGLCLLRWRGLNHIRTLSMDYLFTDGKLATVHRRNSYQLNGSYTL